MIKFLLTLVLAALSFLGFSYLSKYDLSVEILVAGYSIQTSALFLILQFLLSLSVFSFIIFLIKKIICSPYILYQRYLSSKNKSTVSNIIHAATSAILGDKDQALKLGKKFLNSDNEEYKKFGAVIMTLSNNIPDQIHYLHELLTSYDGDRFIINKKIMHVFLNDKNYHQAAFYGYAAFVENEHDAEVCLGLIISYCKVYNVEKASFFLEKAERDCPEIIKKSFDEISSTMLSAAEELLGGTEKDRAAATILLKHLSSDLFKNEKARSLLGSL